MAGKSVKVVAWPLFWNEEPEPPEACQIHEMAAVKPNDPVEVCQACRYIWEVKVLPNRPPKYSDIDQWRKLVQEYNFRRRSRISRGMLAPRK